MQVTCENHADCIVVYEAIRRSTSCPVCEMEEDLRGQIEILKDEISNLEE